MSGAVRAEVPEISALFELDANNLSNQRVDGRSLLVAVQKDIERTIPLSRVVFMKQITGNTSISTEDLDSLLQVLKLAMVSKIEESAEAGLSYAHAAILCATELTKRR